MDYDQVIMTLFRQLDDEQKEIFIATVRKAWEKDRAKMGEPKAPSNAAGLPQTEAARSATRLPGRTAGYGFSTRRTVG